MWFLAIWTLRSRWSPVGLPLYLAFEFDYHFCWVAIATAEPLDHGTADWRGERLFLKRGWERDLPAFLAALDALRLEAAAGSGTS